MQGEIYTGEIALCPTCGQPGRDSDPDDFEDPDSWDNPEYYCDDCGAGYEMEDYDTEYKRMTHYNDHTLVKIERSSDPDMSNAVVNWYIYGRDLCRT